MLEIYAVKIKNKIDKNLFKKVLNCVPKNKQDRIKRFLRYEDSLRTLIAEILIRKIIILKFKLANNEIIFQSGKHGKPHLKGFDKFHFNISHSDKWVVCAISDKTVGIDVEKIKDLDIKIADRFFSEEEIEDLYKKEECERLDYFFDLWTLKESYIKADGRGLNISLNSFLFKIKNDKIIFNTQNKLKNCFFKRYKIDKNYKLSVCSLTPNFPNSIQIDEGEVLLSEFVELCKKQSYNKHQHSY